MGWSLHHNTGLIHCSPQQAYRGYTLFSTNRGGYHANLAVSATDGTRRRGSAIRIFYPTEIYYSGPIHLKLRVKRGSGARRRRY